MVDEKNQSDLRNVVENLVSHPDFRRIVSDAVQQSAQRSDQNVTASTTIRCRQLFKIHRGQHFRRPRTKCNPCSELEADVAEESQLLRLFPFLAPAASMHVVLRHAEKVKRRGKSKETRKMFSREAELFSKPDV